MNGVDVDFKIRKIALENRLWPFALSNNIEIYKLFPDIERQTIIFRFIKRSLDGSKRGVDFTVRYEDLFGDINHISDIIIRNVTCELLEDKHESRR